MSEAAKKIIERGQIVHTLDGLVFVCYRWTAQLAIEALGANALMVVAAESGDGKEVVFNREVVKHGHELMHKVLSKAMISPRLGEVDDADADTVTWLTLGDYGPRLFQEVMGGSSAKAAGFPESSGATTAP